MMLVFSLCGCCWLLCDCCDCCVWVGVVMMFGFGVCLVLFCALIVLWCGWLRLCVGVLCCDVM